MTGYAVGFGVEGCFQATNRGWTVLQHLFAQRTPSASKLLERHHRIHQTHPSASSAP